MIHDDWLEALFAWYSGVSRSVTYTLPSCLSPSPLSSSPRDPRAQIKRRRRCATRPSVPCMRRVPAALPTGVRPMLLPERKTKGLSTYLLPWPASQGALEPEKCPADLVADGSVPLMVARGNGHWRAAAAVAGEEPSPPSGRCGSCRCVVMGDFDRSAATAGEEASSPTRGGGGGYWGDVVTAHVNNCLLSLEG